MAFRLDACEDLLDLAVRANNERSARYADHFLAVHVLLFENTVSLGDFLVDIAQQRKRQFVFLLEPSLRARCIGRDP